MTADMNVLFVSIDSLRRDFLGAYQEQPSVVDYEVQTDNLDRFAERATVFDSHYAGSLPCMPARREWMAGVQEFLWRSWGPMEPFDVPLPRAARESGAMTQFITDHYHYFQHGSNGYYEDFNGFDFIRGHEYDAWQTSPKDADEQFTAQINATDPDGTGFLNRAAYARNVEAFEDASDFFASKVFSSAADWLRENQGWEQWLCYVDSFDVHEPFHCPEPYASMYTDEDPRDPDLTVWPYYGRVDAGQSALSERDLDFVRSQFAGKVTMVDEQFGRVLDTLDENDLWDETMVVVTSDHGYFLGDHGWIGKNDPPVYDVLANTPLMIWHPDIDQPERLSSVTSAVDIYATILEGLDAEIPEETHSRSLLPLLADPTVDHRDWAIYGYWGSTINVTDGRYTYLHPNRGSAPPYCHSTQMINPHGWFVPPSVYEDADADAFLPYTESPVWRFTPEAYSQAEEHLVVSVQHDEPLLFDGETDPRQRESILEQEPEQATRMRELLVDAMTDLQAPANEFARLELDPSEASP